MIEYQCVIKAYKDKDKIIRAVDNVSMKINKGEMVFLLGPSGCGKTTFLRLTNRLERLTSGNIYIDGENSASYNEVKLRQKMGYVIQQVGLFPNKTVRQNIGIIPKVQRWPKNKIENRVVELLEMVNLDPEIFKDRYPAELSGGQSQRVGVARALAADPDILLMDEPFGAIDPINREQIQNFFMTLQTKLKKTVIFVSHDIQESIKMADKIALFSNGKLIQYSTPLNLLTQPENDFVSSFFGTDRALKILGVIKVVDVMNNKPVNIVQYYDSANSALNVIRKENLDSLIVLNNSKPLGYVTEEELKNEKRGVGELVKAFPTRIKDKHTLKDVLAKMLMYANPLYIVVNENGDFEGYISYDDIQKEVTNIYSMDKSS